MPSPSQTQALRNIPAVEALLEAPPVAALLAEHPRALVVEAARAVTAAARRLILSAAPEADLPDFSRAALAAQVVARVRAAAGPHLIPVINATGVVLHTNLGRAPLAEPARAALAEIARGYSNLEYDLETGERGSRHSHCAGLLTELTGAEAALVVNNNAAAVLLTLAALAAGREVVVARGQLVEIGGSFRVPEVMEASGCRLREVGTTNKVYLRDYEAAIGPETALLLKVHTSNYRILGFTASVSGAELAALGARYNLPTLEDLGSGVLVDLSRAGLEKEPTALESVAAGLDIVTFSGDKLLGGPQAGIIVGRKRYLDVIKRHPLARALRVGKLTLAALEATLRLYREPERAWREIPALRALSWAEGELKERAQRLAGKINALGQGLTATVQPGTSEVGGGALPLSALPTHLVAVTSGTYSPDELAGRLRRRPLPVIGRIGGDRLLLDLRTVRPEEEAALVSALAAAAGSPAGGE
ncbi:L-seryl-tRNA(Sec) selenium transferase [Gelria sp. Kuro-4]|uniref:L-seryl-tRNA(Sec) selenium transferase n=1 Tax=Gelria sp. Kuro-4 TaxID=2796927 RepID=UPI001BF10E34|nr:L-seryl-tRNA(Sec) selenium transferase [Gelria sp. Kuro-4]BCV23820.1 L-seryl-tRNA(Sec) selenium transferase [Gelria sp. Kuro-4]